MTVMRLALTSLVAAAMTVWAQPPMPPMPGAPEYPQGDARSPQSQYPPRAGAQNPQAPQSPDDQFDDTQADAPDRGVARISFMQGNVSMRRGDSGDLVAATVNAPVTIGDRVVTGDGRAEVQFDSANLLRLGPASEVRFSELQYHRYQIQIAAGTATFRVLRDSDAQVEISTPSISIHPLKRGVYRVNIRPDGTSEITLRAGAEGEVFGPRGSERIRTGSTMLVRGSSNDPEFQVTGAAPDDDFDRWGGSRDQQLERAVAPRYVPRDVYGAEDLDGNGRWVNDGSYGQVWQPTGVDPGWAPYQCGRWVWMDYYGWTWVGCESWGWAPYHYGRWYYGSVGWAWWPGPLYGRYYWRPALVGFFGWGGGVGFGVGFGFGHVGWVPLAPFERFHPWYGRGVYGGGFRGGSVVNNVNVTNVYRNARFTNAVTSMRAGEFGRGSVTGATSIRASAGDLQRAGSVRGQLPVTPSRESTQFTNRSASTQGLPRTTDNARFFSRSQPSQANRVPFEQQRQSFSNRSAVSGGATGNSGGLRSAESPAVRGNSSGAGNNSGWQRFNPGVSAGAGQGSRPSVTPNSTPSNNDGWQRSGGYQAPSTPQSRSGYGQPAPSRTYSSPPQQLRISPPIVQNRGNSGGGGGSRPSSAPAPRSSGGGGGGGSHGASGGGSSHSSGGGHSGGGGRH
jgi:hypothetical protein